MRVLVTGGAGYIGSHVVRVLASAGHQPIVVDDLRQGHREAVAGVPGVLLIEAEMSLEASLDRALEAGPLDGAIHMAASCQVGESMRRPGPYYENNLTGSLRLIETLLRRGVRRFVFSSTAAVYGEPDPDKVEPIDESHPCCPTNVYGETKLAVERAMAWFCRGAGLEAVSLRYFNAAGADPSGAIGEDHAPETHLIPLVLKAALDETSPVTVMGRDYPTPDGTCLRDYVHVTDLAGAHLLALERLVGRREGSPRGSLEVFNLGAQRASSVVEVIEAARRVTGRKIPVVDGPRRSGDPSFLLASSERIQRELGWRPEMSDLDTILTTAWRWHQGHPGGYGRGSSLDSVPGRE